MNTIRYHYPDTGWVLNGIDLSIETGEYTVVFGANGSGKSTLGYLLNGLIPHFFGGTLEGSVTLNGIDTRHVQVSDLFSQVGLVLQNADAQLFNSTVENEIAFGLESLGLFSGEIKKKIDEIAQALHIENLLERSPDSLSGGEKRLVAIASVLCLNPSVLLLDEPFANLDWKGIKRVRRLLQQIHRSGKNVIVIEQRLGSFLKDSTLCLIAEKGRILFEGTRQEAHKRLLREHLVPNYTKRIRQNPSVISDTVLKVQDLSYRIGGRQILKGVCLDIKRGETVAVVGENGSGKTTLIKHFNGLLRPSEGEVIVQGETIQNKPPAKLAPLVGVCFQNPNDQFFKENTKDEILVGPRTLGVKEDGWFQKVCDVLELHELLDRPPYRLSEGEKKRVSVASILAMQPSILVLDEPTVGQDGRFKEALANLLGAFEEMGVTIVVVTHDLEFAQAIANRWVVLHDGCVVADGSHRDIIHDAQLIRMGALDTPLENGTTTIYAD